MQMVGTRVTSAANRVKLLIGVLFGLLLLSSIASAQSTISGVVRDASGAVIANATVEASSDVLIEKSRSVTTNAEGRYAIVDLRPGTYVVTITSMGFDTVKQTVVVPANVTVPIDAQLKIGSVGETVNVEARVATVDVENTAHPETLTRSDMDALPTGRYMQSIASYVPGAHLNLPDIGGSQQIEQNYISLHGNSSTQDVYMFDGMLINTTYLDGAIQQYVDNEVIAETTYQNSNNTLDASGGGMYTNIVPKEGGNQFHGDFFGGGSGGSNFWQGNNLDKTTALRGLGAQDKTVKIEDFDGSFGGPIKHDKLWFLLTGRRQVTFTQAGASTYPNGAPGIQQGYITSGSGRLTYQLNSKNKISAFWLRDWKEKPVEIVDGGQEGYVPADPAVASTFRHNDPYYIAQGKWTSTWTPKLITELGFTISQLNYTDLYQAGINQAPFTQQWYALTTARDQGTGRRYFAGRSNQYFQTRRTFFTANSTYVTGSHQIRFGWQYSYGPFHYSVTENGDGYMLFTNGVPTSFTALNTPYYQWPHLNADLGLFAMDTWHFGRFALTFGVRWEYLSGEIEAENAPAGRFAPARSVPQITCSSIKGMSCWKDWAPRVGLVYDVFGNHKTALKAGFGKFNDQYSTGFTNNFNPMTGVAQTLTWTAAGANLPQCATVTVAGLPAPNPNCFPTGGFNGAGALPGVGAGTLVGGNPANFGVASSTGIALDPNWHRSYNFQYNAGVQQQLANGVTLNFNWYRRSQYQQTQITNFGVPLSAWQSTTITNPLDGSQVPFFYLPSAPGPSATLQTNAPQSLVKNVYTGFETSVVARLPKNAFAVFGWTIDRDLDRSCSMSAGTATSIAGSRLNDPNTLRYCDEFGDLFQNLGTVASPPWQNEFKASVAVPIHWGFIASTSFYSNRYQYAWTPAAGTDHSGGIATGGVINDGYLARTWTLNANSVYPANCVGCTPGARVFPTGFVIGQGPETINLVAPGQVLTPRLNQLDVGIRKTFRFKERLSVEPEVQAFNILNSNAAVIESTALTGNAAPLLPKSACTGAAGPACGLGGPVVTITNPRLLRVALLVKF
ncbi:MAG TPA: carboxypeptidase regulatory-like domain-containing protein [Bryobacteraceae bacterium]|nr:carboxypeptidase regulatory-like domain-containing protein [Bryobacteraceae bacterium]